MSSILPPIGFDTFHDADFALTDNWVEASGSSRSASVCCNAALLGFCPSLALASSSASALAWSLDLDWRRCFFCDRAGSSFGSRFRFLRAAVSPFASMLGAIAGGGRSENNLVQQQYEVDPMLCRTDRRKHQIRLQLQAEEILAETSKKLEWGSLG